MTKPRGAAPTHQDGISGGLRRPFDLGRGSLGGGGSISEPGIELPNALEISPEVAGGRRKRIPERLIDEPLRRGPRGAAGTGVVEVRERAVGRECRGGATTAARAVENILGEDAA